MNSTTEVAELPDPIDEANYDNGVLIEPKPGKRIKGWTLVKNRKPDLKVGTRANYTYVPMLVEAYPVKIIKFQFEENTAGIAVAGGPGAEIIESSIDNSDWPKQDPYQKWCKQLYLPCYYTLGRELKNGKHTIQIR